MNKEVVVENKKEDKKHIVKFIIICVLAFFGGAVTSYGVANIDEDVIKGIGKGLNDFIIASNIYVYSVAVAVSIVATIVLIKMSRKEYANGNTDDENMIESIEQKLSIASIIAGINQILIMVCMGIGVISIFECESKKQAVIMLIVLMGTWLVSILYVIIAQQKIVNFEKELNPEKRGSVFDTKFQEKWMDSFDEAEKWMAYEAAFASYKTVNNLCMVLCIVCMILMTVWNVDIVALCMVGLIWIVLMLSYGIKAMQLERRK